MTTHDFESFQRGMEQAKQILSIYEALGSLYSSVLDETIPAEMLKLLDEIDAAVQQAA